MTVITLRLDDAIYERLRTEAFEKRTTITALIREALTAPTAEAVQLGCDVCGKPHTHISTPGGFRFCDEHGGTR